MGPPRPVREPVDLWTTQACCPQTTGPTARTSWVQSRQTLERAEIERAKRKPTERHGRFNHLYRRLYAAPDSHSHMQLYGTQSAWERLKELVESPSGFG